MAGATYFERVKFALLRFLVGSRAVYSDLGHRLLRFGEANVRLRGRVANRSARHFPPFWKSSRGIGVRFSLFLLKKIDIYGVAW